LDVGGATASMSASNAGSLSTSNVALRGELDAPCTGEYTENARDVTSQARARVPAMRDAGVCICGGAESASVIET
jgi:hypothetical protein